MVFLVYSERAIGRHVWNCAFNGVETDLVRRHTGWRKARSENQHRTKGICSARFPCFVATHPAARYGSSRRTLLAKNAPKRRVLGGFMSLRQAHNGHRYRHLNYLPMRICESHCPTSLSPDDLSAFPAVDLKRTFARRASFPCHVHLLHLVHHRHNSVPRTTRSRHMQPVNQE